MKKILVFLVAISLIMSCRPAPITHYRVTIKNTDGIVLYEDEKPSLRVNIERLGLANQTIKATVYIPGERTLFEIAGSNLLVTREPTKREEPK